MQRVKLVKTESAKGGGGHEGGEISMKRRGARNGIPERCTPEACMAGEKRIGVTE